jgi:WD40 repeat protein
MVLEAAAQSNSRSSSEKRRLQTEINVIREWLHSDNHSLPPLQPTTSTESMDPGEWIEIQPRTPKVTHQVQSYQIAFPSGLKARFTVAGLSPACSHACFLSKNMLLVYSLSNISALSADKPVLRLDADKVKYYAAALSHNFVAILVEQSRTQKSLQVVQLDGKEVGTHPFGTEGGEHKWEAGSLIAIHEAGDRTWIAVGGCVNEDRVPSGSIQMYCVDKNAKPATLERQSASFTRTRPNPLKVDFLKTLAFSPDGRRLVCATNDNRILVWRLSNNARPQGAPFIFQKELKRVRLHPSCCCSHCADILPRLGNGRRINLLDIPLQLDQIALLCAMYDIAIPREGHQHR